MPTPTRRGPNARRTHDGAAGRALAAAVALGLVWAAPSPAVGAGSTPASGSIIVDGRRVFETKGCAGCHAVWAAEGQVTVGPDLGVESAAWQDVTRFAGALWNHLPGMAARMEERGVQRVTFEPMEMRALTAYLFYAKFVGAPGDAARGAVVFDERGCSTCHQFKGRGGRTGPRLDDLSEYASVAVFTRALWDHAPFVAQAGIDTAAAPHRLGNRDAADVVAFIRVGEPRPEPISRTYVEVGTAGAGRAVFERFGCVWCHEPSQTEAAIAPNLAVDVRLDISGLAAAFWNHGPVMMARMEKIGITFPVLGDTEMADLLAYLAVQQFIAPGGDPERGRRLLQDKTCAGCHGPNRDEGTPPAPDLERSEAPRAWWRWAAAIWNHPTTGLAAAGPWPRFEGDEMRDLVASLRPEPLPK